MKKLKSNLSYLQAATETTNDAVQNNYDRIVTLLTDLAAMNVSTADSISRLRIGYTEIKGTYFLCRETVLLLNESDEYSCQRTLSSFSSILTSVGEYK